MIQDFDVITTPHTPTETDVAHALCRLYDRAQAGLIAMIEFGSRVAQVQAALTEQAGPKRGPGSNGGLKGWLAEHCPGIPYRNALRYRDLAQSVAQRMELDAPAMAEIMEAGDSAEYDEVVEMVEGKSARQLMFSFSAGRGAGRPKGTGKQPGEAPYRPPSIAEMEEMATVELEGIISDLGNFFQRQLHLRVMDQTRRNTCRLRLLDLANLLK